MLIAGMEEKSLGSAAMGCSVLARYAVRLRPLHTPLALRRRKAASKACPELDEGDVPAGALSGGNQQKVVIAKWLMAEPRIILLNDPTRGIDVGTKQEIYVLLRRLADAGAAIVFYTTDYDELIGCCDRALVLYDGAIKRVLRGAEITERALIMSALNIGAEAEANAAGTPS